jgi:hypothetical protein
VSSPAGKGLASPAACLDPAGEGGQFELWCGPLGVERTGVVVAVDTEDCSFSHGVVLRFLPGDGPSVLGLADLFSAPSWQAESRPVRDWSATAETRRAIARWAVARKARRVMMKWPGGGERALFTVPAKSARSCGRRSAGSCP